MTSAAARRGAVALPPWAAAATVGLVTLCVAMAVARPYVIGAFHDDAIYVILGRALASGAGYRYLHLPGTPHATHYPPGYPALLALLWRVAPQFPDNVLLFERANACLLGVAAALGYTLVRRSTRLTAPWAGAVAILGTATIPSLALATVILSESLFLAVLLGALVASEVIVAAGNRDPVDRWTAPAPAIAGLLCGAVGLVRTVGIVVVPAAVAVCLIRRRPRAALVVGVIATAMILPWQLWVWRHSGELAPVLQGEYGSYSGWLTGALGRHGLGFAFRTAQQNVSDIVTMLAIQFAPQLPLIVKMVAIAASAALTVAGLARMARTAPVTAAFAVLYAGEVVFWPFPPFRFVWAVWFLVVLVMVSGAIAFWEWRPRAGTAAGLATMRVARAAALLGALIVGAGVGRYNVLGFRGHWWNTMQESLSVKMNVPLAWLASHPALRGVVASDQEPAIFLYAGRTGVPCNSFTPDEYIYPRDTAHDRAVLGLVLRRFPVGAVVATGPACALAALRLTRADSPAQPPALIPVDTMTAGFAVFARGTP
ncbi:MAG: hypothetical protein ACHQTF_08095 [Gemmatimonadales bacterium]